MKVIKVIIILFFLSLIYSSYGQNERYILGVWSIYSDVESDKITLKKINPNDKNKRGIYAAFKENKKFYSGILNYIRRCGNDTYRPKVGTWELNLDNMSLNIFDSSILRHNKFKILQMNYDTMILKKVFIN